MLRKAQRNLGPPVSPCGLNSLQMRQGWTCEMGKQIPPGPNIMRDEAMNRREPELPPCPIQLTAAEQQEGWTVDMQRCKKVPPGGHRQVMPPGFDPKTGPVGPSPLIPLTDSPITEEQITNNSSDIFNRRGGSFRRKGGTIMGSGNWRGKTVPGMRRGGVIRKK